MLTTNEKEITICASQWEAITIWASQWEELIDDRYLNYGAQTDVRVVTALLCVEHEVVGKGEEDREQDGWQGQVEAGPQGSVIKGTVSQDFFLQVFFHTSSSPKFFASGFFHKSSSPKPLKITLGSFQIFSKFRVDIC